MLVFHNKGRIPLDAITTAGISAKLTDSAIGQFGTGLKVSIASILRMRGSITILVGRRRLEFGTRRTTVRGQEFEIVTMNGRKLGFTTHWGSTWEPWEFYRELWSNARDESGSVARVEPDHELCQPAAGETRILVDCPELERCHEERHKIILQSEPLMVMPGVEVHAGESEYVFYRGIRAMKLQRRSMYTYSVTARMLLTENRTIQYPFMLNNTVARGIMQATNMSYLAEMLSHRSSEVWEDTLPWSQMEDQRPSPQFMEVCDQLRTKKQLGTSHIRLFNTLRDSLPGYVSPYLVSLTETEEQIVQEALQIVQDRTGMELDRTTIEFKSRQDGARVSASRRQITVRHAEIEEGPRRLASSILQGAAMRAGGGLGEQLASLVLDGSFIPEELTESLSEELVA